MRRRCALVLSLVSLLATPAKAEEGHRTRVQGSATSTDSAQRRTLDQTRLDEAGSSDLPALLAREPGLYVPRLGGLGSYATLSIRGSTPEQVLITFDGIPLNLADGSPVDLAGLPLGPLQRVDIYRGRTPWGTGQVGLGGALALHSASTTELSGEGALSFGSHGYVGLRGYAGARPFSIALDYLNNDNTFSYTHDNGTAWNQADDFKASRQNAHSRHLHVLGRSHYQSRNLTLNAVYLGSQSTRGLTNLVARDRLEAHLETERHLAAVQGGYRLSPLWRLNARLHAAWSESLVSDPQSQLPLPRERAPQQSFTPGAVLTLEGRLFKGVLVPVFHLSTRYEGMEGAVVMDRTLSALAGELHWRLQPTLKLSTGLRGELGEGRQDLAAFLEFRHEGPWHQLGLSLHQTPRRPSLFERFGDHGLTLGNPDLRSEVLSALEVDGVVRSQWGPLFGEIELSLYARKAKDLIAFLPNAQGISRPENLANATLLGADLSLSLSVEDWLELRSTLSLLDARDASDIAARRGKRLPMRPALQSNNRLELRYPLPELSATQGALGLAIEADLLSANYLDPANLVQIPTRTIVSTHAFLRGESFEVRVSLLNVGNSQTQDLAGYPLPGRSGFVLVKVTP